ncbi:MAG: hypothetical protein HY900_17575 [Deltaproteobacteria bacterium]|nr:hypothetical protein [Deltaproteobacteria bacterium]
MTFSSHRAYGVMARPVEEYEEELPNRKKREIGARCRTWGRPVPTIQYDRN